jgi:glycosyltransferase involved in cell wall biosynthesis
MVSLSVLIPSRKEEFLNETIDDLLRNIRGNTNIIVVLDGAWPDREIKDNPKVILVHHTEPIGQRAATNEAARISQADFVMKADAHCAFDEGFDVKLLQPYEDGLLGQNVTTIPRMYNLHVFNWICPVCKMEYYQANKPEPCCGIELVKSLIWKPRFHKKTDFARIDKDLLFQYWQAYGHRREARHTITDVMCAVGACWLMSRARYNEIEGLDEGHGSWGQMGVEIACKSWLSGGRQVVNKRTWFSHLFRKGKGFGWPYPIHDSDIEKARDYSRDLWLNNKWHLAVHEFSWLLNHFAPVPEWHV